ncbi:MAG TPA: PQQ-binding-like beta-propeller repeat protein, partial [Pirellulales bacterium]
MEVISHQDRWVDANAVIADDRVLITPVESDQIFCLKLSDGSKIWDQPRGENIYIAGVHEGNVLLVGKHQFTPLRITDGKLAWSSGPVAYAALPKAGVANNDSPVPPVPSGRGFLSGDEYFLPLSSAEVISINLNDGKIAGRTKSRKGIVPGNLVCHDGEVISQGVDDLETFYQIKPLRERIAKQLAESPDDPWALAHRGELALADRHVDDALVDLRHAYQLDDNSYNRELYIEAMRSAISQDFNNHRDDLRDWERIAKLDSELAIVLRVKAVGLAKSGESRGALDALIKLTALEPAPDELDRGDDADANWSVARARWVRMHFDDLWQSAKAGDRAQIESFLQGALDRAIHGEEPIPALRQFVRCFGDHPLADRAREILVERLSDGDTLLEREELLRQLALSSVSERKIGALVKFAELMQEADQPEAALATYKQLELLAGQRPVLEGKSVQQILSALPAESPLRLVNETPATWRKGAIESEKASGEKPTVSAPIHSAAMEIELRGEAGQFLKNVALNYDYQRQEVYGRDSIGKKDRFLVSLGDVGHANNLFNPISEHYAFSHDHLLALSTGYQLFALDTLRPSSFGLPGNHIVWQRDLTDANMVNNNIVYQQSSWNSTHALPLTGEGSLPKIGPVGPCTANGICYLRGRDATAIDPITGSVLWVRHGIEPSSEVFGDEEVTVIVSPENISATRPALVLRTADGKSIVAPREQRPLPAGKRLGAYGHNVLMSRPGSPGSNSIVLAMYDPLTNHDLWTEKFTNPSGGGILQGSRVDNDTIAIMHPEGNFVMLRLADGHRLIDQTLEKETGLQGIVVMRSAQQDILITNRLMGGQMIGPRGIPRLQMANVLIQPPAIDSSVLPVTGHVYAFDRATGKPEWKGPAYVELHGLLQAQPADLPVITFVRTITPQHPGQAGQPAVQRGSVLCLDKRTGACVYNDDNWPENLQTMQSMLQVSADPEKQTVSLQWGKEAVALTFTDKPASDQEPYQAGKNDKPDDHADGDQPSSGGSAPPTDAGSKARIGQGAVGPQPPKRPTPATDKAGDNKTGDNKPADGKTD